MNAPKEAAAYASGLEAHRIAMQAFTAVGSKVDDIDELGRLLSGANLLVMDCMTQAAPDGLKQKINFMDPAVRQKMYLLERYVNQSPE